MLRFERKSDIAKVLVATLAMSSLTVACARIKLGGSTKSPSNTDTDSDTSYQTSSTSSTDTAVSDEIDRIVKDLYVDSVSFSYTWYYGESDSYVTISMPQNWLNIEVLDEATLTKIEKDAKLLNRYAELMPDYIKYKKNQEWYRQAELDELDLKGKLASETAIFLNKRRTMNTIAIKENALKDLGVTFSESSDWDKANHRYIYKAQLSAPEAWTEAKLLTAAQTAAVMTASLRASEYKAAVEAFKLMPEWKTISKNIAGSKIESRAAAIGRTQNFLLARSDDRLRAILSGISQLSDLGVFLETNYACTEAECRYNEATLSLVNYGYNDYSSQNSILSDENETKLKAISDKLSEFMKLDTSALTAYNSDTTAFHKELVGALALKRNAAIGAYTAVMGKLMYSNVLKLERMLWEDYKVSVSRERFENLTVYEDMDRISVRDTAADRTGDQQSRLKGVLNTYVLYLTTLDGNEDLRKRCPVASKTGLTMLKIKLEALRDSLR